MNRYDRIIIKKDNRIDMPTEADLAFNLLIIIPSELSKEVKQVIK